MRKITVPNSFFTEAAEVLKNGQSVKIHVDGQSMYPFIKGGFDQIEIVPYNPTEELRLWCCPFFRWREDYLIQRFIGKEGDRYKMMGDGNIYRIEEVRQNEIIGVLRYIYHPDGSVQDCMNPRWLKWGERWYRMRSLRRFLLPVFRIVSF